MLKFSSINAKHILLGCLVIITSVVFITSLSDIVLGRIPFWYDPARDLLLGLDNHLKPTLIGQPTGIPGVFYGPYWIWVLSLIQYISLDPRVVALAVLLIPYFVLFLFVLMKFKKVLGLEACIIIWLLFIVSFKNYFTSLWNPHLLPLFLVFSLYVLIRIDFRRFGISSLLKTALAGFLVGLTANFSMSFGLGIIVGTFVYLFLIFIYHFFQKKESPLRLIRDYAVFILFLTLGLFISFGPFLLFEMRHGFNQIDSLIRASTSSVVTQTGMMDKEIILTFLNIPEKIFKIPSALFYSLVLLALIFTKQRLVGLRKLSEDEVKLILVLFSLTFSTLFIYLISKNPVWDYHFIGFEIIFLFLIGILINRSQYFKKVGILVIVVIGAGFILNSLGSIRDKTILTDSLRAKEDVTENIYADTDKQKFLVYAYNPSIYTFDYDYLFKWYSKGKNYLQPVADLSQAKNIYLIFAQSYYYDIEGFTQSKTPSLKYKTTRTWKSADNTLIIKRNRR